MNRFHKISFLFCTLFCLSFITTGCEKAPQRAETENKAPKAEIGLSSEKYVSIKKAHEQIAELEGNMAAGFHFPDYLAMPEGDTISEVKLIPWEPRGKKDFETALQNLWSGYNTVDWSAIRRTKRQIAVEKNNKKYFGDKYFYIEKENEKTGIYYSYDSNGFFCGDSLGDTKLTCESCVKKYDFEWGDTSSDKDTYPLEDGNVSVSEAVSYVETLLNQHLPAMERNQFSYKVQHLYVVRNEETGYYDYNMSIGRVYQGVLIDTSSAFTLSEGKCYDKIHSGKNILATMRHKNKLDYINICDELLTAETETAAKKIISPFWAVQQMNQKIAHLGGLNFVHGGLVYLLVQDNQRAKDNVQDIFQGVAHGATSLRPVWLFMSQGSDSISPGFTKDNHGTTVVTDAIDGTLYYYEEAGI